MSPQRPATLIDTDLDEQWRAIDTVLNSLAQRSRARRGSDEEEMEEPALRAATTSHHSQEALRQRLEEVTRERDELRVRLAAAERGLRSARARLMRLERPKDQDGAGGSSPDPRTAQRVGSHGRAVSPMGVDAALSTQVKWLHVVRLYLRRRRSD